MRRKLQNKYKVKLKVKVEIINDALKKLDEATEKDDVTSFSKVIKMSEYNLEDFLKIEKIGIKNSVEDIVEPYIVKIIKEDALNIFKLFKIEPNTLIEFKREGILCKQPLLHYALQSKGTKVLEFLVKNPECQLFYTYGDLPEDLNSFEHLIIYTSVKWSLSKGNNELLSNTKKKNDINLCLMKVKHILDALQEREKTRDELDFKVNINSMLEWAVDLERVNQELNLNNILPQKIILATLEWGMKNQYLKFLTEMHVFELWNLNNDSINSLLAEAKQSGIGVKIIKQKDFFLNKTKNLKKEENYCKEFHKSPFDKLRNDCDDKDYLEVSWEAIEEKYKYLLFFNKNNKLISNIVNSNEEKDFHLLFEKIKFLTEYAPLSVYYNSLTKVGQIITEFQILQPIHVSAVETKKFKALGVILKAICGFKYEDNPSLRELIAMSEENLLLDTYLKHLNPAHINLVTNADENTILHYAVIHKNIYLIKKILTKQPNVDLKNKEGKTALALAKDLGLEEIAERIEKYKIEKIKTTKGEGFIPQIEKFEIPTQKEKQKSTNEEQQKKFEMAYLLQTEKGISFELISKKWSPAEIKSFKKFTQEKDRLGKQEKEEETKEELSWAVDEKTIYSTVNKTLLCDKEGELICHKHEDKTYYFASEIQLNPQQMIALEHGFIIGLSKGKTGLVPYTDAPIIKIKSKGDKRIYAANKKISIQGELIEDNDIVENSKGAVLVIFTKIVKHKEMQRVVDELKGSKLKPALVKDSIEPKTSSNLFLAEDDLNLEYYHTDSHEYSTKTMGGNNEIFEN